MTKEQALKDNLSIVGFIWLDGKSGVIDKVMKAMDDYAKQECIEFLFYASGDLFDNESAEWNYNRYIESKQ